MKVLAKGGILVSIVSQPSQEEADSYGVRQSFVFVQNNATQLAEIAGLVDSGPACARCRNCFAAFRSVLCPGTKQSGSYPRQDSSAVV